VTRRRVWLVAGGVVASILIVAVLAGVYIVESGWLDSQVRRRMIAAIENATGGRAELGAYRFDWRQLRAEIDQFVLHGNETTGKPPLLRAKSIAVGIKIISVFRADVDIRYLDVKEPQVYLIVYPDGRTNVPEPKIKAHGERTAVETLLNLAVGRFSLQNGAFEVEGRGTVPFDASGRNLDARFSYEPNGPRYRGGISIQPLEVHWDRQPVLPLGVQMTIALAKNQITVDSAKWTTRASTIQFSGTIDDLTAPRAAFQYAADVSVSDANRILHISGLESGKVQMKGSARWAGSRDYAASGGFRASGLQFRQEPVRLRNFSAEGALRADANAIDLSGIRFAGESLYDGQGFPIEGRAAAVSSRRNSMDFRGASLSMLGGDFEGAGSLEAGNRIRVEGQISGVEAKRAVAAYNRQQALPWDSLVSGSIRLEGSLRGKKDFRASARLNLAPARVGPPVRGDVAVSYDATTGILDLGDSVVNLPSSRIEAAGAIGRRMTVRLETRDLNDLLPVLGENLSSIPVKLENGTLSFDGTVTGRFDNPQVAGHASASRFLYSGERFDSLVADVTASRQSVALQNAVLNRGTLRAQFRAAVGLHDWTADAMSPVTATGAVRNASLTELLALLGQKNAPITGTLNTTGQVSGTIGNPQVSGDIEVLKGALDGEPFDRITLRASYTNTVAEASSGQLIGRGKQVRFQGSFTHASNTFTSGRLRFQVETDSMLLDQFQTIEKARPGIQGNLQLTAAGTADIAGSRFRLADLRADVAGRGLQLAGKPLGDAHLRADTEGSVLHIALDSGFANSMVRGQGELRLEGDYPGSMTVTFSKLDLAQLRDWVSPSKSSGPSQFSGFAEGELRVEGPALKPELLKAELRIPNLEIGAGSHIALPDASALVLHNSGPILATATNSVVTITSARLVGRSTDITIGGRVLLQQKSPLDLHGNGRIDLGLLHDFDSDLTSSGVVTLDAAVRGGLDAPQVSGRMEVANAALNYADFPNGISNANGAILFTGDRATIQRLSGETGGGKFQLTGFTGYGGGQAIFRLHANAQGVRVRYPAGVSTVANANLNFTGTTDRSMISGTVTILRSTVNLESDFSSLLAKSSEPVQTPSARAGFLGGLNFDVEIQTSPDVQFETSLTQGVEANAGLRLSGTATNPALIGRINITQGQVVFYGTKYNINQGTISFYNPVKIDPVLDIDLQTKARGIDVTLTVAGPVDKLTLTPRSDPPLQFNEIVALLATGRTPASDLTLLNQQGAVAQPYQASTGSALLGQVIANPVSGRLQRFFGISNLRIDPTLPGIEYNPQARLTLEQQVTPDITFTYITNVTSANPLIVSVQWAFSKQWSAVAERDENGVFGLDFFYKTRFK